jgi:hypothetical protein
MKDLLDLFRKDLLQNLNCHHIGTIESFDAENQLATATVNYTQTYFNYDEALAVYKPVAVNYPVLVDCPVICLGGGNSSLTFPIQKGDECVVLFNDRDLDNWYNGGPGSQVATPRLHSFSDGIILVGIRSNANRLQNYDTSRAVLQNGNVLVGVGPAKVKIGNGTSTLFSLLSQLVTAIQNLKIDVAGVGPSQGTVDSTSITQLTTIASELGGLLE